MAEQAAVQTPEVQTPATDPAATPAAAPEQKVDSFAPKFAALSKRERQLRIQSQQYKLREQAFAKREAAVLERERAWNEEFNTSPLEALKKRGRTYQDLTNAALNEGKFQPDVAIKDIKDEIQRMRDEGLEKERLSLEDARAQEAAAEQEAIETFQGRISDEIATNKDKYELTSLYEASDLVYQTVEEHYNRTKKVMTPAEACGLVEQYLESELERTAKESKKFQSKFAGVKQEEPKGFGKSSTTLSNSLNSSAAPSMLPQHTEDDRIRRALAKLG